MFFFSWPRLPFLLPPYDWGRGEEGDPSRKCSVKKKNITLLWVFQYGVSTTFKVSVNVNLGLSLVFLLFANLESVCCKVYFPKKYSEKLYLKPLKSLCFVSRHNLRAKMIDVSCQLLVKGLYSLHVPER